MKKMTGFLLAFALLCTNALATTAVWDKTAPASSSNAADIGTNVATANNAALDRLVGDYRRDCTVIPNTTTACAVLAGEVAIPNSDASVVRWQANTTTTAVTSANIDVGGAFSSSTQYYVYAVGDSSTTFTVSVSTSSSAPSGKTYYRKIGYFYIDASGYITSVGNVKGGDVGNAVWATGATDITRAVNSFATMTDMTVYFVGSGRPVKATFQATVLSAGSYSRYQLMIDGSRSRVRLPRLSITPLVLVIAFRSPTKAFPRPALIPTRLNGRAIQALPPSPKKERSTQDRFMWRNSNGFSF